MGQGIPGIFQRRVSFIISSFDSLTLALPSVAFCCCAAQDRPAEKRKKRLFLLLFTKKNMFLSLLQRFRMEERKRESLDCHFPAVPCQAVSLEPHTRIPPYRYISSV